MINLYIDDSGTKEKNDPKVDIFSYGGFAINQNDELLLINALKNLKTKYFGTTIVEIKSRNFRLNKEREKHYLQPYGLSIEDFTRFSEDVFGLIKDSKIVAFGSVVSKDGLKQKYTNPFDASPVAYEILMQRFVKYLGQTKEKCGKITIDDMKGKNSKGSDWKKLLIKLHSNLQANRSVLERNWRTRSVDYSVLPTKLLFIDSRAEELIQIADLIAYNIMRQGKDYKTFDGPKLYTGYTWIKEKMHTNTFPKKRTGYGGVYFP